MRREMKIIECIMVDETVGSSISNSQNHVNLDHDLFLPTTHSSLWTPFELCNFICIILKYKYV